MPRSGLALLAILAVAPVALAQVPLPPGTPAGRIPVPGGEVPAVVPPVRAVDPALKATLDGWEKVMKGSADFYTKCELKRTNLLLKKESVYEGTIMCMKPNLARLRLDKVPAPGGVKDPNDYTAYICTGQAVYEYDGNAKQVTEIKLRNGGIGDNILLEFMSGNLTADDAIRRFDIKELKSDQHYVYLEIKPVAGSKEKADFEVMTLVLFQPTVPGMGFLPRTVVIRKSNQQDQEVWNFPEPKVNLPPGQIKLAYFDPIPVNTLPMGWKVQQVPQQPAPPEPRVARP